MEWMNILDETLKLFAQNETDFVEFKSLKTNLDRTKYFVETKRDYLKKLDNFVSLYPVKKSFKCENASEEHRNSGKKFYSQRSNRKAFNSFCDALMHSNSPRLTFLAYSNRSAVFYDEKMYQNCILDIDKALQHFNLYLKSAQRQEELDIVFKLLNRKKLCCFHSKKSNELKILKDFIKTELSFNSKLSKLNDLIREIDDILKDITDNEEGEKLESIKEVEVLSINDCVDIKYSEEKGRYCTANRNIMSGEYLFVEKAYCAILIPEFSMTNCQNCLKKVKEFNDDEFYYSYLNVEFCSNCNDVVFCSEKCKLDTSGYHYLECGLIADVLHNLGISHLAYKIVTTSNEEILSNYKQLQEIPDIMKLDYINEKNLRKIHYEQVFSLVTHENDTHVTDLFKYTLTSIMLGSFYIKLNERSNKDDLIFVSTLILRHLLQTICNAHAITDLKDDLDLKHQTYSREQIRYATAIYPKVSLMNHSCDSNVISSFKEDSSVIVVRASRDININEEIFNCYGPHYLKMSLPERKQSLLEQYHFVCLCPPCTNESKHSNLKCLKCNSNSTKVIGNIELNCQNCSKIIPIEEYVEFFNKIFYRLNLLPPSDFSKILQLANEYKSILFINKSNELELNLELDDNFKIFYLEYSKILDRLSRVNCDLGNFVQGAYFCEKSIKILEAIYGSNCIEIANESFKLAEIQCNFQDFDAALSNVNKSIAIAQKLYSKENKLLHEFKELKKNILNIKC